MKGEHEIELVEHVNLLPAPTTFRITTTGSIVYDGMEYYSIRAFLIKLIGKRINNYHKHIKIDGKLFSEYFGKPKARTVCNN